AWGDLVDKLKGFSVGGVDYLTKPFVFEEVLARADAHITLYRQRQEIKQLLIEREKAELAERQHRLLLNVLLDTATAINSTLNLNQVLTRIAENVGRIVSCDAVSIILFEEIW